MGDQVVRTDNYRSINGKRYYIGRFRRPAPHGRLLQELGRLSLGAHGAGYAQDGRYAVEDPPDAAGKG